VGRAQSPKIGWLGNAIGPTKFFCAYVKPDSVWERGTRMHIVGKRDGNTDAPYFLLIMQA